MTDTAQATETSNNAPQPSKGDQLEGKKADTLTTKQAANMFKGSMISDTADDSDTSEDKKAKTPEKPSKKAKKSEEDNSEPEEEITNSEDEETGDVDEDEDGQSDDDEADDVEDGADTDEDADSDEGDDEGEADDEDLHTVIVDGEEEQVTYEELVSGYQRQSDYTKKSMELADQRKALETEKEQIADLPRVKEAYASGS